MDTIVTNESSTSQGTGWYCFVCNDVWVNPRGVCADCQRRAELAQALHLAGMTAVPDPSRSRKRTTERVHVRLMALLEDYGYLTRWGVPDVRHFAHLMGRSVGAVQASLRVLAQKGWLEVRKRGNQNEYRVALQNE